MTDSLKSPIRVFLFFLFAIVSTCFLLTLEYYRYREEYYCLISCYEIVLITYFFLVKKKDFDMFHPYHIFFVFYLCIFFYTPLLLIDAKNELLCGLVNVMGGCVKGTIIATFALIFYAVGYSSTKSKGGKPRTLTDVQLHYRKRKNLLRTSYVIYMISCVASFLYLLKNGKSVLSILLMGAVTSRDITEYESADAMLFLINITYFMLVPWLFICTYSKSTNMKFLTSFILLAIFYAYGWRFIIYIMILAYSIVYFRVKNKKPKLKSLAILGAFLLMISVYVGATRNNIRSGNDIDFTGFTKENISYTLESNFNIYQTYYAVVDYYPEKEDFYYGQACFLYPVIMWVPRALWPGKPFGKEFPAGQAVMKSVPEAFEIGAMSFPNLMEYYLDFGVIGVILFSYLIGVISKKMVSFYNSSSVYDVIVYSLFIGFSIQFINRGYIAQLITLFVFLFSPLLLYRRYYKLKT